MKVSQSLGQRQVGLEKCHLAGASCISIIVFAALRQILLSAGHCLKTRTLQNVEEFIMPLSLKIQNGDGLPPYSNAPCRMDLYRVLQAMVLVSHSSWQPSVHCIIRLFSTGQRDANIEVC